MAVLMAVSAADRVLSRQRQRVRTMEQIRQLVAEDPAFISDLRFFVVCLGEGNEGLSISSAPDRTHFEKIRDFFTANGNKPSYTSQIVGGTGLSLGAVGQVIYKDRSSAFE